jgi:hypothetical protein
MSLKSALNEAVNAENAAEKAKRRANWHRNATSAQGLLEEQLGLTSKVLLAYDDEGEVYSDSGHACGWGHRTTLLVEDEEDGLSLVIYVMNESRSADQNGYRTYGSLKPQFTVLAINGWRVYGSLDARLREKYAPNGRAKYIWVDDKGHENSVRFLTDRDSAYGKTLQVDDLASLGRLVQRFERWLELKNERTVLSEENYE